MTFTGYEVDYYQAVNVISQQMKRLADSHEEIVKVAVPALLNALRRTAARQPINIVFDGPPSAVSGRFVEVELDDGSGVNAGEWIERPDGKWALRITELP